MTVIAAFDDLLTDRLDDEYHNAALAAINQFVSWMNHAERQIWLGQVADREDDDMRWSVLTQAFDFCGWSYSRCSGYSPR